MNVNIATPEQIKLKMVDKVSNIHIINDTKDVYLHHVQVNFLILEVMMFFKVVYKKEEWNGNEYDW